jgi:hypothetical protein
MRWYKKIQSDIEYDVLRVLIAFLRLIPRRALLAFARVFGHIVYTVVPIRKRLHSIIYIGCFRKIKERNS